jgi:hypothetical protein
MSNDTPPTAAKPWYRRINPHWIGWFIAVFGPILAAWITSLVTHQPMQPPGPVPPTPDEPVIFQMGWKPDPEAKEAFVRTLKHPTFATTPAGDMDVPADVDVFLWKYTEQAWAKYAGPAKTSQRYPNINQNPTGICVGAGAKHSLDVLTANMQEFEHTIEGWEPIAVEAIYAESRTVGRRKMGERDWRRHMAGQDGSNGSWAAEAATTAGNLVMQPYDGVDLSHLDPMRARAWGDSGLPAKLQPIARRKLAKSATQVKSWEDCRRALAQHYSIILCSNVGFNKPGTRPGYVNPGTRDADGFVRPNGEWSHCMALIGMQGGKRPGGFILNSWGDDAHKGPTGKGVPPVAGFWADADVIDRMCRGPDCECYAFSGFDGFPARNLNWSEITRDGRRHRGRWLEAPFALAP